VTGVVASQTYFGCDQWIIAIYFRLAISDAEDEDDAMVEVNRVP
jgi:hypothetical protein